VGRKRKEQKPLPTIWHVPDALWVQVEPILLAADPPKATGRKRVDPRKALDGIIFRLRTGCQWNRLPKELGDDSSIHRTFQRWNRLGVFDELWATLLLECEELGGVDWQWQSVDGQLGKARGVPKKGHKTSASVPIRPTEPKQAPRRASSSKETAGRSQL